MSSAWATRNVGAWARNGALPAAEEKLTLTTQHARALATAAKSKQLSRAKLGRLALTLEKSIIRNVCGERKVGEIC
jgi:hypothetical protein